MGQNVIIELLNVSKKYNDEEIVSNLNLKIYENEFLTLLGPSGCGKTTTLRMIAGFEDVNSGKIIIENKDFTDMPPYARPINTVFQKYALFPHLDVIDNVEFGLKNRNLKYLIKFFKLENYPKNKIKKKIKELIYQSAKKSLELVNLNGFEDRKIDSLSGGQQQRVALARAIINKPKILLLDEPLAALDLKLRRKMQYELKEMQQKLNITFVFVTHDQEEAMTMSDRIVVMDKGKIIQLGTPKKIYNEPVNRYVATFIGESNIIRGIYLKKDLIRVLDTNFECMGYEFQDNEIVDVVIRPEDFDVVPLENAKVEGIVLSSIFKGVFNELMVKVKDVELKINTYENYEIGQPIGLKVDPYEIHLMKVQDNE